MTTFRASANTTVALSRHQPAVGQCRSQWRVEVNRGQPGPTGANRSESGQARPVGNRGELCQSCDSVKISRDASSSLLGRH